MRRRPAGRSTRRRGPPDAVDPGGAVIIPASRGVARPQPAVQRVVADEPRRRGGTSNRHALVIGGTGMLVACASSLIADGWHVVLPSRRYSPIPTLPMGADTGKALWVAADWADAEGLAERAGRALGAPAELLVTWVRREHRRNVLQAVEPLLAVDAPVVEVHGSAAYDPVTGYPDPVLADHPTQQVVLGFVPVGSASRRLNHEEISEGVLDAVDRALAGKTPGVYQVGEPRPWSV